MPQPLDTKSFKRLVKVLNVGSSPQAGEADAALSKGIAIMEERGFTIDELLEYVRPDELPQTVCAELARRYCLFRPELTSSAKDEYYRSVFLKIAEKYSPSSSRQTNHTRSETQRDRNEGQSQADADWVRNMDERRRRAQGQEPPRPSPSPASTSRTASSRYSGWFVLLRRLKVSSRSPFLQDALRNPERIVRFFLACCLFSILPGFALSVAVAGFLDYANIHIFDQAHWSLVLVICTFPFLVYRGLWLYRSGGY